ncbi:MAG: hypothetical protein AABX17_01660 [Nanoarchaeota archaeon]
MAQPKLELGQLVLCTVRKIDGTTVFVTIDEYGIDGTLTFMEIAPGRIRNIREYAFPGKKIVCKVLQIKPNHVELSFRRVKTNERNEFNDKFKREKSYSAMLRTILGDKKPEELITKIKSGEPSLVDYIDYAKENPAVLEKYLSKEDAQKIIAVLKEKKTKEKEVSQRFSLSSKASDGVVKIKSLIQSSQKEAGLNEANSEITYLAAGRYMIRSKASDLKQADTKVRKMFEILEKTAKKNSCIFNEEK